MARKQASESRPPARPGVGVACPHDRRLVWSTTGFSCLDCHRAFHILPNQQIVSWEDPAASPPSSAKP